MMARVRLVRSVSVGCVVLCIASAGCSKRPEQKPPAPPAVKTVVAAFGTIAPSEQLAGFIAPFQNVAMQSTLSEPADQVNVQEGDRVSRGELLALLDTADLEANLNADLATAASDRAGTSQKVYSGQLSISQGVSSLDQAQASLRQAQANLQRDQTDLGRYQSLVKQGYISEQQYQTQAITVRNDQQAVRQALAGVQSAQSNVQANGPSLNSSGLQSANLEQARANEQVALAQADQLRVQIAKARILSPISGVVVNRNLNPGEYPGTRQIFTLQQVDPVYAVLRGSSAQVAAIQPGAHVTVSTDGQTVRRTGSVVGVLNQIAPGSTDFQVKVLIPNPDGRLRPGVGVSANVALSPMRGVRVPTTAFTDDNHDSILAVDSSSTVHTVRVTEVANDGTHAIVTGLPAGSRVIADGQISVGSGEKVAAH
ncbi:MAG TPA: efflux RND transporter periplasmic adaptor subunit [Candidatus Baltobacteraceae bacterium]|nr:efflux RND transporter periplasmic adaptor subunit [Candidatus Baltobacteraceae bacterium]